MEILKYKEQKDGSALLTVGYTKEEGNFIKKYYNKKKITNKLLQKFIIEGLENYIKKEK